MRLMSLVKVVLVAGAVALPSGFSGASAKAMKLPPGACAFQKKAVNNGAICSYNCDPKTMWCAQQVCGNGQLFQVLSCYGNFCSGKC